MSFTLLSTFYCSEWKDPATPRDLQPSFPISASPAWVITWLKLQLSISPRASLPAKCMGPANLGDRTGSPDPLLMPVVSRGLDSWTQELGIFKLQPPLMYCGSMVWTKPNVFKIPPYNYMQHLTLTIWNHFSYCKCLAQSLWDKWWVYCLWTININKTLNRHSSSV